MRFARFAAQVALVLGAGAGSPRAQIQSNPNQIQGTFRFSNVNPAARAILDLFPVVSGTATATHPTLGRATTSLVPAAGGEATFELSVQATPGGASHEVTLDYVRLAPGYEADSWSPSAVTSPPVFPEPAPDVELVVAECAAIVRVLAVDQTGARVPWPSASATSTAPGFNTRSSIASQSMEDHLVLPVSPSPWTIYFNISGNLPATATVGPVGCDEIADVQVTLVPSDPNTATTCSVVGVLDFVGEFEHVRSGSTWVTAVRVDAFSSFEFRSAPAEGPYEIPRVTTGSKRAWAYTAVRLFNEFQQLGIESPSFECLAETTADLGTTFVMEPGHIRGGLFIAGPSEAPGWDSALRHVVRAASRSDGMPEASGVTDSSLSVEGTGPYAWRGWTRGLLEGDFVARTAAFEGDFDLLAAAPVGVSAVFRLGWLNLELLRESDRGPWLSNIVQIFSNRPAAGAVPPGAAVIRNLRYCTSEVEFAFVSTAGEFQKPRVYADGTKVGRNFEGTSVDYRAAVATTPETLPPATTASVHALLPEGSYLVQPSIEIVNPGGGITTTSLTPFPLTVGCGERVRVFDTLQVRVTSDVPACGTVGPLNVTGAVSGGADVARLTWRVNGGPDNVSCAPCGIDPVFDFTFDIMTGENDVVIEATDVAGRSATAHVSTRVAPEPSASDLDPSAEPLRVTRASGSGVRLTWQAGRLGLYAPHRGTIGSLWAARAYDHMRISSCDLTQAQFTDMYPGFAQYYLVTSGCGLAHGSYGRDSFGIERPASRNPCP